jgi:hypothetical protein
MDKQARLDSLSIYAKLSKTYSLDIPDVIADMDSFIIMANLDSLENNPSYTAWIN